jgi:hypothetical protein
MRPSNPASPGTRASGPGRWPPPCMKRRPTFDAICVFLVNCCSVQPVPDENMAPSNLLALLLQTPPHLQLSPTSLPLSSRVWVYFPSRPSQSASCEKHHIAGLCLLRLASATCARYSAMKPCRHDGPLFTPVLTSSESRKRLKRMQTTLSTVLPCVSNGRKGQLQISLLLTHGGRLTSSIKLVNFVYHLSDDLYLKRLCDITFLLVSSRSSGGRRLGSRADNLFCPFPRQNYMQVCKSITGERIQSSNHSLRDITSDRSLESDA